MITSQNYDDCLAHVRALSSSDYINARRLRIGAQKAPKPLLAPITQDEAHEQTGLATRFFPGISHPVMTCQLGVLTLDKFYQHGRYYNNDTFDVRGFGETWEEAVEMVRGILS